ncbi:hypothetical protein [Piscirickettsia salmonis]|nr:hypothetical protein [Piscirickettsia salmonis]QGP62039.1 hypothetical protein PsalBI1_04681 [Piscirickettsia salmonis]
MLSDDLSLSDHIWSFTLNARRRASLDYRAPNHVFLENLMAA